LFNPEIGVIADLVATASESSVDEEGNDRIAAREIEVVFGHPVDPYSRLDVTDGLSAKSHDTRTLPACAPRAGLSILVP
jgi:hypothetical protein